MTLYILFAGLGTLFYTSAALAFFLTLVTFLVTFILFEARRRLRGRPSPVVRGPGWNMRIAVAMVFFAAGVGVLLAATREAGGAGVDAPPETRAAIVDHEPARALELGRTLFEERGCVACHRSDGAGVGPSLQGRFGSQVEYPGSTVGIADESYIRESILTPTATVAAGFPPIMPTFAGRLTEEELSALVLYVQSLSGLAQ